MLPGSMLLTIAHLFHRHSLFSLLTIWSLFLPTIAHAALAIDASSPARATETNGDGVVTTGSFTPPNTSLLLALVQTDTEGNVPDGTITLTCSSSPTLTWTNIVQRDPSESSNNGYAGACYALVTTGQSTTVTVTMGGTALEANGTRDVTVKVYVVTGHDTADPIGASGEGESDTNAITPTIYTSTVANSRGFGAATDWQQLGTPSSTDTGDTFDLAGDISGLSAYKAADTGASSTAVSMNFDAAGTSAAEWNWIGVEVNPPAAAAAVVKRKKHFFWFIDW